MLLCAGLVLYTCEPHAEDARRCVESVCSFHPKFGLRSLCAFLSGVMARDYRYCRVWMVHEVRIPPQDVATDSRLPTMGRPPCTLIPVLHEAFVSCLFVFCLFLLLCSCFCCGSVFFLVFCVPVCGCAVMVLMCMDHPLIHRHLQPIIPSPPPPSPISLSPAASGQFNQRAAKTPTT